MKWVVRCKIGYYSFDVVFNDVKEAGDFMIILLKNVVTETGEELYATLKLEMDGENE